MRSEVAMNATYPQARGPLPSRVLPRPPDGSTVAVCDPPIVRQRVGETPMVSVGQQAGPYEHQPDRRGGDRRRNGRAALPPPASFHRKLGLRLRRAAGTARLDFCRSFGQFHAIVRELIGLDHPPQHAIELLGFGVAAGLVAQHLHPAQPPAALRAGVLACDPIQRAFQPSR